MDTFDDEGEQQDNPPEEQSARRRSQRQRRQRIAPAGDSDDDSDFEAEPDDDNDDDDDFHAGLENQNIPAEDDIMSDDDESDVIAVDPDSGRWIDYDPNSRITSEDFMELFFYNLSSDEYEKIRQIDAKELLPDKDDAFISGCLGMLHGVPKIVDADERRRILFDWTQSSRAARAVAFMSKPEMKELARRRGFYDNIKWSPKNSVVRERVTKWLEKVEYPHLVDEEEEEPVCQGEDGYLAEFMVSSYLRPQKKGDEEGHNKYTIHGHRAERPFMKKFYDIFSSGGRQSTAEDEGSTHPGSDVKIEAIYSPGLVYKKGQFYMRDSSDGVAIVQECVDDEIKRSAIPIEVKSRCAPRTYMRERCANRAFCMYASSLTAHICSCFDTLHRQRIQHNSSAHLHETGTHDVVLADVFAYKEEDTTTINPLLHKIIPPNELFQMLHHISVYGSDSAFFLIGNDKDLMAAYRVFINNPHLIDAYLDICEDFYTEDLEVFYAPGKEVPTPPKRWMDAFKLPKLRWLKMDKEGVRYHLGLWRALNIDPDADETTIQKTYPFPFPQTVRIIIMSVSLWNALKGGGDTITHLLDLHKERLGIRTDVTTACARILMYFAVLFHRVNQWCNAKTDLKFYPSISHARHANNERAAFMDSLMLLCELLLSQSRKETLDTNVGGLDGEDAETIELNEVFDISNVNPTVDESRRKSRRSTVAATPAPIQMEVAGAKTGNTPVYRSKTNPSFEERCDSCIGVYFGKLLPDPDLISKVKDGRIRRQCYHCHRTCEHFCFGCRRFLCFSRPKQSKDGPKHPKYFTVKTPILNKAGEVQKTDDGYKHEKVVAEWTCFHAAHMKGFRAHLQANRANVIGTRARSSSSKLGKINEEGEEDDIDDDSPGSKRRRR